MKADMLRPLTDRANEFLDERGLDLELCAQLGLRSMVSPKSGEWLAIPYHAGDDSRPERHKFRCLERKDFRQWPTGAPKRLWNRAALDGSGDPNRGPLVITEGELDAIVAIQAGYRAVAFGDGAPTPGEEGDKRYEAVAVDLKRLQDERQVILAVDGDEAGRRLYRALVARIGPERCLWVTYPEHCKDLNDALVKGHDVGRVLLNAKLHDIGSVRKLSDIPPAAQPVVYRAGVPWIDDHVGFVRGHVSVWTGVPGHGKSTLLNWLCVCLTEKHDWRIAFASFEQDPRPYHEMNLKRLYLRQHPNQMRPEDVASVERWIDRQFRFIIPPETAASDWHQEDDLWADLQWIMGATKTAVIQAGCDMLVIDPWNEIEHSIPRNWTETNYIGFALRQVRRMARALNIHVALVAHPRKMAPTERPTLYDIAGSANWANKVELGCVLWRDKAKGHSELHLDKVRYEELLGQAPSDPILLAFDAVSRRFSPADTEE